MVAVEADTLFYQTSQVTDKDWRLMGSCLYQQIVGIW